MVDVEVPRFVVVLDVVKRTEKIMTTIMIATMMVVMMQRLYYSCECAPSTQPHSVLDAHDNNTSSVRAPHGAV